MVSTSAVQERLCVCECGPPRVVDPLGIGIFCWNPPGLPSRPFVPYGFVISRFFSGAVPKDVVSSGI